MVVPFDHNGRFLGNDWKLCVIATDTLGWNSKIVIIFTGHTRAAAASLKIQRVSSRHILTCSPPQLRFWALCDHRFSVTLSSVATNYFFQLKLYIYFFILKSIHMYRSKHIEVIIVCTIFVFKIHSLCLKWWNFQKVLC